MKILKSWLKEFVDFDLSDNKLESELARTGTEVESIIGGILGGIVVVKIVAIKSHPNADRLQVVSVSDGKKEYQIVCGAKNIRVGQIVPMAKIGTILKTGKIDQVSIRGVKSYGMLCSEAEIGIGTDSQGIKIFPKDTILGPELSQILEEDSVFELEITPNRGDCLSHLGIAREVAAFTGKKIKRQPVEIKMISDRVISQISLEVRDPKLVPNYQLRLIDRVKVDQSPEWLKNKLEKVGLKPINNIVDVTNYVMLDLGQPLHAFDFKKISGQKIIVREALKGEKIQALNDTTYQLGNNELVIADDKKPLAIAGIIGGKNSEIDFKSNKIILEAAVFDRRSIRRTSKIHNITTDASYRFERDVDPNGVEYALNKAAMLISEIAGGQIYSGIIKSDITAKTSTIKIENKKINRLLGIDLSEDEMKQTFRLLGFVVDGNCLTIPSWRHDINCWQDLAEEIGRIYGYDKIKFLAIKNKKSDRKSSYFLKEVLKDCLSESGFSETISYSFLSEFEAKNSITKRSKLLEVKNPVQPENRFLRDSLLPSLFYVVAKNSLFNPISIFELNSVYTVDGEKKLLAIVVAAKDRKIVESKIDRAITNLRQILTEKIYPKIEKNYLKTADINRYKIKKSVVGFVEIDLLSAIEKIKKIDLSLAKDKKSVHYRPISKYPPIARDLAFVVDKKHKPESLIDLIYDLSDKINRVELFDKFSSDKLGEGKISYAFHLYLQNTKKTMVDSEADEIIDKIINAIRVNFSGVLRS